MNEHSPSPAGLSRRDVLLGGAIATVTAASAQCRRGRDGPRASPFLFHTKQRTENDEHDHH